MNSILIYLLGELILSSALKGQVLLNNQPVVGATIQRESKWAWADETIRNEMTTGTDGKFYFEEIMRRSLLATWLPHEPTITTKLTILHQGKTYEAFVTDKHDYKRDGEFNGKHSRLVCHLERPPARKESHYGICDVIYEPN
jgi:hypothetical protein